jgi:uncharacterized protein (DUF58 family)
MPNGVNILMPELLAQEVVASSVVLRPKRASEAIFSGAHTSNLKTRGMEFAEVRPYQMGDDVRSIDWKQTAKTGKPFTKIFSEEKQSRILFVGDFRSTLFFGTKQRFKSILAARTLAKIIFCAKHQKDKVGGVIINKQNLLNYAAGTQTNAHMKILADISKSCNLLLNENLSEKKLSMIDALEKLLPQVNNNAIVFVVSDFYDMDDKFFKTLSKIRIKAEICLILIEDDFEVNPQTGTFNIRLGELSASMDLDNTNFHKKYKEFFAQRIDKLMKFCLSHAVHFFRFNTSEDDIKKFKNSFFSKRGKM